MVHGPKYQIDRIDTESEVRTIRATVDCDVVRVVGSMWVTTGISFSQGVFDAKARMGSRPAVLSGETAYAANPPPSPRPAQPKKRWGPQDADTHLGTPYATRVLPTAD